MFQLVLFSYRQGSETSSGGGGGGSSSSATRSSSRRTSEEPHIGKYRLLKTIGKGNFAKVKLAKHIPTGKEVNRHHVLPCTKRNTADTIIQYEFQQQFNQIMKKCAKIIQFPQESK